MEYMILIHTDENAPGPQPGSDEFTQMLAIFGEYNKKLMAGGHWVSGASLQPTSTATTVKLSAGKTPAVVDGPFAETKEQLGGFYVVSAENLDEAIELARQIPMPSASIEVRPVSFRADAETNAA